ncbi:MAG: hypothetical protein HGA65_11535, partial [Oscillochloris sp.]|nr:hypothetical protein [Oscillochloris sp.]
MAITQRYIRFIPLFAILALLAGLFSAAPTQAASSSVSPQSGGVGTRFEFRADGFTPQERVDFWLTGPDGSVQTRYPSVNADASGAVAWSWDVAPGTANGHWDMTAFGIDSDLRVVIGFSVVGSTTTTLPTQITPASGPRGTTFKFSVGGMNAGERVSAWLTQPNGRTLDFDPGEEFRIYADENGSLSWTWTAPSNADAGIWLANVRGMNSGRAVDIRFTITGDQLAGPSRYVSPAFGAPGTIFTVVVGGLNPGEEAGSWLAQPDGSTINATSYIKVDDNGVATWTWESPTTAASGTWQAVTKAKDSQILVAIPFTVGGNNPVPSDPNTPSVSINPSTIAPSATITISVSGFAAFEELIFWPITPDGQAIRVDAKPSTDERGAATWTYQVPQNATAGQWSLSVRGDDSSRSGQASFNVTRPGETMNSATPASGGPGTTFTFVAGGFRDDYEKVYFWFVDPNGRTVDGPKPKNSDNDNTVTWEWTAPSDVIAGQWLAVARGDSSHVQQGVPFTVVRTDAAPTHSASVSPTSGSPGTTFTFTADGYKVDERVGYWLNQPDGSIVRFDREIM